MSAAFQVAGVHVVEDEIDGVPDRETAARCFVLRHGFMPDTVKAGDLEWAVAGACSCCGGPVFEDDAHTNGYGYLACGKCAETLREGVEHRGGRISWPMSKVNW